MNLTSSLPCSLPCRLMILCATCANNQKETRGKLETTPGFLSGEKVFNVELFTLKSDMRMRRTRHTKEGDSFILLFRDTSFISLIYFIDLLIISRQLYHVVQVDDIKGLRPQSLRYYCKPLNHDNDLRKLEISEKRPVVFTFVLQRRH